MKKREIKSLQNQINFLKQERREMYFRLKAVEQLLEDIIVINKLNRATVADIVAAVEPSLTPLYKNCYQWPTAAEAREKLGLGPEPTADDPRLGTDASFSAGWQAGFNYARAKPDDTGFMGRKPVTVEPSKPE